MEKCKLCKTNDANKPGSHIISHWLLKRIDNIEGKKQRDYELGFVIEELDTPFYFGGSVSADKLEDIFGKLSDEEIDRYERKTKSPLIVDNFFCLDCETRLSRVEDKYAETLTFKTTYSKINPEIAMLFWVSIFWRISLLRYGGLILKPNEENLLRQVLNKHLKLKYEDINLEQIRNDVECKNFAYRIIRCPDYDEAQYIYSHPTYKRPYSLLLGEFVVFFYFKLGHIDNIIQVFCGFEKNLKGTVFNTVNNGEQKIIYSKEDFKNCIMEATNLIVSQRLSGYDNFFDNLHNYLLDYLYPKAPKHREQMPEELKNRIFNRLVSDENPFGRRYNLDALIDATLTELKIWGQNN